MPLMNYESLAPYFFSHLFPSPVLFTRWPELIYSSISKYLTKPIEVKVRSYSKNVERTWCGDGSEAWTHMIHLFIAEMNLLNLLPQIAHLFLVSPQNVNMTISYQNSSWLSLEQTELGTSTMPISDNKVPGPMNVVLNNTVEDYINTVQTPVRTLTLSFLPDISRLTLNIMLWIANFPFVSM